MTAPSGTGRTRQSPRIRGLARIPAIALLVAIFSSTAALAQTVVTSLTGMNGPTFLALDTRTIGGVNSTWLYVAEHGNTTNTGGGRILRYNTANLAAAPAVVATAGTGNGQFVSPDGIVVDPSTGDLYIADRARNRIQRITNTGTFVDDIGVGELRGPAGLARDSAGNLYVAEHGDTTPTNAQGAGGTFVSKYNAAGVRQWRVGGAGTGNGQFIATGPYGVAVSGSSLLVSDAFASRIQSFSTATGAYQSQFSTGANTLPLGLSIDSTGALWTAISSQGSVQEIRRTAVSGGAATMTLTNGFNLPFHAVVDTAANRAYVADYENDRVVVFNLATSGGSVPVINSASSSTVTVGQSLNYQITATNGPIQSYALVSGTLPAGITLNTQTGTITGVAQAAGSSTVGLTATNSAGTSAPFSYTITVNANSTNTPGTPALPLGPTITAFDLVFSSVVQGVSAEWEVVFSAPVTGVDASDFVTNTQGSATASIAGVTAVNATTYRVRMNYTDQNGSIQVAIRTSGTGITNAGGDAFRGSGLTATPVYPTGTTGAQDVTLPGVTSVTAGTASGNNVSFTVTFSEPVTGVGAGDFIITGTSATIGSVTGSGTTYTVPVTASGSGTVTLTVVGGATSNIRDAATNLLGGVGNTSASATIAGGSTGGSAPTITSATTATGTVGSAFSYTITASGSPTSYAATNLSGTGLSLNTSTGVISGTPTAAGTITSQLTATNANGTSAPATLTITVSPASTGGSAPTITSATTAAGTVGSAFSYTIAASGSPTSYAATNLAGTGLSLNASTGVISGTPTAAGTISSQLTATNANGTSAPVTLTITVSPASTGGSAPTITSATSASATVGSPFSYTITASGSPTSYNATGLAGTGLTRSGATISGTPTAAGTITSQLTATNANGTSAPVTLTITVAPASTGGSAPVVTGGSISGTVGSAIAARTVTATNSPTSWSISGQPAGITINNSGVISGTPTASGTFNATVTATNATGSGSAAYTFTISPNTPPPPPPPPPPPVQQSQTVTLIAPTSAILVGDTLVLEGGASSGLPLTYSVVSGSATLSGNSIMFTGAGNVVVRASQAGNLNWAPASAEATFTVERRAQQIVLGGVEGGKVAAEKAITLDASSSSGLPVTYTVVSGPATIEGGVLTFTGTGAVVVRATQAGNGMYNSTSTTMTFQATPIARLTNLSSRMRISDPSRAYIAGFVVTGDSPKQMLIRAVGPSLAKFGLNDGVADPELTLFNSTGVVLSTNAGWNNDAQIAAAAESVYAFPLDAGSEDAALLVTLAPGSYTAQVKSNGTGIVVVEVYDVSANAAVPTKQLINISTRGFVGTGNDVLIGGFVVSGEESKRVLVRAVGPALEMFGVSGTLADPVVRVYNAENAMVAQNDNWGTQQPPVPVAEISMASLAAGAFPLPAESKDAVLMLNLQPGSYTAVVSGADNTTGEALVEIYEIPNP